jgi:hypothetical protein
MRAFRSQGFDDQPAVCSSAERLVMRKCKNNDAYSDKQKRKEAGKKDGWTNLTQEVLKENGWDAVFLPTRYYA